MKKDICDNDYVRVTQVLAPFNDFSKIPPQTLEDAKIRGTLTHDICELYALDSLIEPIPEICKGYFESFKRWYDENVSETIQTEERLHHPELFFTGKFDWIGKLKGDDRIVLADWKTPVQSYPSWQIQSGAYYLLLDEVKKLKVDRRITVQLKRDGSAANVIEYTNHTRDSLLFLNSLELYRFFNS